MEGFDEEGFGQPAEGSMPAAMEPPVPVQGGEADFFGAPAEVAPVEGAPAPTFEAPGGFVADGFAQPEANNGFGDFGGAANGDGGFTGDMAAAPVGEGFAMQSSQPLGDEFSSQSMDQGDGFVQEAPAYSAPVMEDPDNPLTIWREQNQQHLSSKVEDERANQAQLREVAQEKIAELEAQRQAQVESTRVLNREKQEMQEKSREEHHDNVWEAVVGLVEMERDKVPEGRRDTSRFRQMLVKLKHTPPAPIGVS